MALPGGTFDLCQGRTPCTLQTSRCREVHRVAASRLSECGAAQIDTNLIGSLGRISSGEVAQRIQGQKRIDETAP